MIPSEFNFVLSFVQNSGLNYPLLQELRKMSLEMMCFFVVFTPPPPPPPARCMVPHGTPKQIKVESYTSFIYRARS